MAGKGDKNNRVKNWNQYWNHWDEMDWSNCEEDKQPQYRDGERAICSVCGKEIAWQNHNLVHVDIDPIHLPNHRAKL